MPKRGQVSTISVDERLRRAARIVSIRTKTPISKMTEDSLLENDDIRAEYERILAEEPEKQPA